VRFATLFFRVIEDKAVPFVRSLALQLGLRKGFRTDLVDERFEFYHIDRIFDQFRIYFTFESLVINELERRSGRLRSKLVLKISFRSATMREYFFDVKKARVSVASPEKEHKNTTIAKLRNLFSTTK
jgi:hypothetical protein